LTEFEKLQKVYEHLKKLYEKALKKASLHEKSGISREQKYYDFIELAADAFFHGDNSGNFIDVNESAIQLTGYSREELLIMNMRDLFSPAYLITHPLRYDLLKEGKINKAEREVIQKSGNSIFVEMNSKMMPDGTFQSIFRDVTERRQAEDALRESEFRLARAEKVAKIGNWKILLSNKTMIGSVGACDIYGVNVNKTLLEDAQKIPLPEYRPLLDKALNDLITKGIPYDLEFKICRNSDKKIIDIHSIANYDSRNNIVYGVIQDITEQKLAERALIVAKERAEESDRLKSAFLANMSHEIRTPMNGILGFASLLKEVNLSGEKQKEYIQIIEKSGDRMLGIINDIVDISKIEAGMMNVDINETNINEQIDYVYTFFKPEVDEKGIRLTCKTNLRGEKAVILTDREKVYAVLINLLKNAIKFTEKGSIEFGYIRKDAFLEFYIKDTGIGICPDRQGVIFERFIQADISDVMARQGAGLGLSISKAYVTMLNGRIWVESEAGKGSTFFFTIPYNCAGEIKIPAELSIPREEVKNPVKNLKILIAEDDVMSEILISTIVESICDVQLNAVTGDEAVEVCRNNPDLDLILMDIKMPVMDGYEAIREIRKFNKEVIIIAQTAYGLSIDKENAENAGCNEYISKPIVKEELLSLIQKYSYGRSYKHARIRMPSTK
jgi:PAS domain S-box-containing protein